MAWSIEQKRRDKIMTNSSSQKLDRESPQYLAVEDGLDMIHGVLVRMNRVKHELVSARPADVPGKFEMKLVSKLLNNKRVPVGLIRVYVTVPDNGDDIKYRVEWTRNAFGFWYWKEFTFKNVVDDPDDVSLRTIRTELNPVIKTADGTVPVKSMNRMYKKIKKNKVRDKVAQAGLHRG